MFKKLIQSFHKFQYEFKRFMLKRKARKSIRTFIRVAKATGKKEDWDLIQKISKEETTNIDNEGDKTLNAILSTHKQVKTALKKEKSPTTEQIVKSIKTFQSLEKEIITIDEYLNQLKDLTYADDEKIDKFLEINHAFADAYNNKKQLNFNKQGHEKIDQIHDNIENLLNQESLVNLYKTRVRRTKEFLKSINQILQEIDRLLNKRKISDARKKLAIIIIKDSENSKINLNSKIDKYEKKITSVVKKIQEEREAKLKEENLQKIKLEELKKVEQFEKEQLKKLERSVHEIENPTNKKEWKIIEQTLKNNGINKLYHYTDENNIRSIIKKGGLYSWKTCDKLGIQIPKSGGNQATRKIDETNNLDNFIKLSFNKGNQMQYIATEDSRIDNLVFLEIDPKVCFWMTTQFSDANPHNKRADYGPSLSHFQNIKLKYAKLKTYVNRDSNPTKHRHKHAEILVFQHIPLKYITSLKGTGMIDKIDPTILLPKKINPISISDNPNILNCSASRYYISSKHLDFKDEITSNLLSFKSSLPFAIDYFSQIVFEHFDSKKSLHSHKFDYVIRALSSSETRAENGHSMDAVGNVIADVTGSKYTPKIISKRRSTQQLKKLRRSERFNELKNIYQIDTSVNLKSKKILIIDDVYTTGATVGAITECLKSKESSIIISAYFLCRTSHNPKANEKYYSE